MSETVQYVAARGEGVTDAGSYVALSAPGDQVVDGKIVERGAGYQEPPCRHFPGCGGCQLQHLTDDAYAKYLVDRIAHSLGDNGLDTEIHPAHLSPPRSRRRASLKAMASGKQMLIGFTQGRTHRIVDMHACHILSPEIFALVKPLRRLLSGMLAKGRMAEIQMTSTEQGVDLTLKGIVSHGLEAAEALPAFAAEHGLARLSVDDGYGPEPRYAPDAVTVNLSGVSVGLPQGAFLQATADGEAALVDAVRAALRDAPRKLDLFAGLGTFAFGLAQDGPVEAAEAARDAVLSLMQAGKAHNIVAKHRDLFRNPYQPGELEPFDGVVIDPPRAGAQAQVEALAQSDVSRIAYVSCNPSSFARDAAKLVAAGFSLDHVLPVGQFRWSTHAELAAAFSR